MATLFPFLDGTTLIAALVVGLVAGFVKGVVGFAMPLVLISGLTIFLAPEIALAGMICATVVTNFTQALRQGLYAMLSTIRAYWLFLLSGAIALPVSAQFVLLVPEAFLLGAIGFPAVIFATMQLLGLRFRLQSRDRKVEAAVGMGVGALGGLTGVWGPPTVVYLTALNTPKAEQLRIQGVFYGGGAFLLAAAHIGSGVLRAETVPFSVLLVVPACLGMWVGGKISDRIDQEGFRRATLIVLLIAGANLVRRAII